MEHFTVVQKIVRAGLAGGDLAGPLAELRLALEGDFVAGFAGEGETALLEQAAWLDRMIARAKGAERLDGPTSQTDRAARNAALTDPVQALLRRGALDGLELAACRRLEAIWELLAAGLDMKARDLAATRVDGGPAMRDPVDRMSDLEAVEVTGVFGPWVKFMQAYDAGVGFTLVVSADRMPEIGAVDLEAGEAPPRPIGLNCYELVRQVLVDRRTVRHLEQFHAVRHGTLTAPLVLALRAYMALYDAVVGEPEKGSDDG